MIHEKVLILDFGSQYTQLIARRVRELKVYCEIHPYNIGLDKIRAYAPKAVILSGGPANLSDAGAPVIDRAVLDIGVPVLGICYGMQLMCHLLGGEIGKAARREYGYARMKIDDTSGLFRGMEGEQDVWMSHGDRIERPPLDFISVAHTEGSTTAAMRHRTRPWFGIQFHPEVAHTPNGVAMLENFLFTIAGLTGDWTMRSFIDDTVNSVRKRVGKDKVILALSGGVDSSVVALLLHKAIGGQLTCIFVDNGLLRKNEAAGVMAMYAEHFHLNVRMVDASALFLGRLADVTDPQQKRKIIGPSFVDVFVEEADKIPGVKFLAQGTLYPDVIESVSFKGPSAVIKTHHNLELGDRLHLALIEPLRELFKDEVRMVGEELGLPRQVVWRHPFPGPGLAIRVLGEVNEARLAVLREADAILIEELIKADWYDRVWQAFCVLLPVKSVGVMGDERTYENVVAIRAVTSRDAMTADWADLPRDLLSRVANRIVGEVRGINRVTLDITSKPPGTIEWE